MNLVMLMQATHTDTLQTSLLNVGLLRFLPSPPAAQYQQTGPSCCHWGQWPPAAHPAGTLRHKHTCTTVGARTIGKNHERMQRHKQYLSEPILESYRCSNFIHILWQIVCGVFQ